MKSNIIKWKKTIIQIDKKYFRQMSSFLKGKILCCKKTKI